MSVTNASVNMEPVVTSQPGDPSDTPLESLISALNISTSTDSTVTVYLNDNTEVSSPICDLSAETLLIEDDTETVIIPDNLFAPSPFPLYLTSESYDSECEPLDDSIADCSLDISLDISQDPDPGETPDLHHLCELLSNANDIQAIILYTHVQPSESEDPHEQCTDYHPCTCCSCSY